MSPTTLGSSSNARRTTPGRLVRLSRAVLALSLAFTMIGGGVSSASADDDVQDSTPPLITIRGVTPGGVYADGQVIIFEFECTDPESGIIDCTEVRGTASGEPVTLEWTEENQGRMSWLVTAVNGAGLESSDYVLVTITREVNTTTTVSIDAPESHGWYNRPVTATVAGSDDSGKAISLVGYDRGFGWMEEYASTAAVEYSTEGTHTLLHYAMNEDGGRSATRETVIRIDFTAPTAVATPPLIGSDVPQFTRGEVVPFTFSCTDALAGVVVCSGDLVSGESLPTDRVGTHSYTMTASDFAGNSVVHTVRYTVDGIASTDTTPPQISFDSPDVHLIYETGKTFRLGFECSDEESEVIRCEAADGVRNGDLVTMDYTPENRGAFYWTVVAENAAGLTTTRTLSIIAIPADSRQPTTELVIDAPVRNGWHRTAVTAGISGSTTSQSHPVREIWTNLGDAWVRTPGATATLTLADEGVSVVEHYATDEDGGYGVVRRSTVRIDLTEPSIASQKPELFADALRDDGEGVPTFGFGEVVPFEFTCYDELSGVESCGGNLRTGGALPTERAGEHRYTLTAVDLAGNTTTRTVLYNVLGATETLAMTGVSSLTVPLGVLATLLMLSGAIGMRVFRTARR